MDRRIVHCRKGSSENSSVAPYIAAAQADHKSPKDADMNNMSNKEKAIYMECRSTRLSGRGSIERRADGEPRDGPVAQRMRP